MTAPRRQLLTESPSYWLAIIEEARLTGNFELIQKANQELARLGVTISFDGRAEKRGRGLRTEKREAGDE